MGRYEDLLSLDEAQREVVGSLHEGYSAPVGEADAAYREAMESARGAFDERTLVRLPALLPEDRRQRLRERRERRRAFSAPQGGIVGERQMVIELEEEGEGREPPGVSASTGRVGVGHAGSVRVRAGSH